MTPARGPVPSLVFLSHCAKLSGAELALPRLLPALEGQIRSRVILAEDGPLVDRLRDAGVAVEVLPLAEGVRGVTRSRAPRSVASPAMALALFLHSITLSRRLRELDCDLVCAYSLKAAVYGGLAGMLARRPKVWHLHDRLAADYMNPAGARLMRTVGRRFDAVIANSRETLRTLELPAFGSPVRAVIAYPIEAGAPATRQADTGVRDITVGMVGRLTTWKGQHVFLRAFKQAFPDGGARAVIVGAPLFGESEYEAHLRALAGSLGLDDRVEFAGFQEDIPAQLARFDILVHASVIPEPFGQVVLEGMAAGLPVVASGAGGPSEVITDGNDGFLFEPGDFDALAAVLRKLAADPYLRKRVGTAARARARDFAPDVIAGQLIPVYLNVLGRAS